MGRRGRRHRRRGWSGLECLSGIPGSAGATPIQNVGAYGQEVAETITAVRGVRPSRGPDGRRRRRRTCGFALPEERLQAQRPLGRAVGRRSGWTASPLSAPVRYAELARALGVEVGDRVPLADVRERRADAARRQGHGARPTDPDTWSVGSFFTNPVLDRAAYERCASARPTSAAAAWPGPGGTVKVSAAWLIDKAGFAKGYRARRRRHLRQAHAGADQPRHRPDRDLLALAREIRDGVHDPLRRPPPPRARPRQLHHLTHPAPPRCPPSRPAPPRCPSAPGDQEVYVILSHFHDVNLLITGLTPPRTGALAELGWGWWRDQEVCVSFRRDVDLNLLITGAGRGRAGAGRGGGGVKWGGVGWS